MSMIDHGVYGVKRQSIRKGNPRNFIAKLLERTPRISDEDLREKVKSAVLKNEDYLDAVVEYWVAGERRNLTRPPRPSHQEPKQREAAVAQREVVVAEMVARIKPHVEKMVLLEMKMTNGKTLAECTFKEVAKFGGQYTALSSLGKPNEKVGKLSEATVGKILR